jgi:hypothetical protein
MTPRKVAEKLRKRCGKDGQPHSEPVEQGETDTKLGVGGTPRWKTRPASTRRAEGLLQFGLGKLHDRRQRRPPS